jgi:ligand-binding sensor domain-containing protein
MLRYIICLVFVFNLAYVLGQADLHKAVTFKNTDALNSTLIKKIVEGPFGFIWIATGDGLFRFDGSLLYPVFEGDFEDIDIDRTNEQFVFTSRENLILRSFSGSKTAIIPKDSLIEGDHILQAMLVVDDSTYWIASTYGVTSYHTEKGKERTVQLYNPEGRLANLTAIARDPFNDKILWLGSKSGLYSFNMGTNQYEQHWLRNEFRLDRELELNSIDALYVHTDGNIYCGSWGAGLAIYNPSSGTMHHFTSELSERDFPHVYAILPESDTTIWISTTTGAGNYNINTGVMSSYLQSNTVDDIVLDIGPVMIDNKGRYWIGYFHGLSMLDPRKSQIEKIECEIMTNQRSYIPRSVTLGRDPDLLYLTVDFSDGLYTYHLKTDTWHCIKTEGAAPDWQFRPWETHWQSDTLWILEWEGLYYYIEGAKFLVKHASEADQRQYWFTSFAWVDNDEVWMVSRYRGLYLLDSKTGELTHYSEIDMFSEHDFLNTLSKVHTDVDGRVWLCSKNQLYVYIPDEFRLVDLTAKINNGQPFLDVNSISEDEQGIWLTTASGIYMIQYGDGDEFNSTRVSDINTICIASDGQSRIWIAKPESITVLNWKTGSSQKFTEYTGLPNTGRHGIERIELVHEDLLFMSARKTFALFRPGDLRTIADPPVPYLVSAAVDGIASDITSLGLSLNKLNIPPDQNSITIDYSAIAYTSQIDIHYRYKLEGVNNEWVAASVDNKGPTYANLAAGKYRFLVSAAGADEKWSSPAILEMNVGAYWWQQNWFYATLGFLGLTILVSVYQIRLSRVRKNSKVQLLIMDLEKKALQAQMNPHFIFNAMNSIQHFMAKKDEKKAMFYLNRFSKLLRSILDSSTHSYVSLKNEMEMLENYILLESLRFEGAFKYEINRAANLEYHDIKIPGFIIQPVVENAIKHGLLPKKADGILKITLTHGDEVVNCTVEDNGVGRKNTELSDSKGGHSSMGIKILRSRLNLYNRDSVADMIVIEDMHADDGYPSGTRVHIKLPIQEG